MADLLPPHGGLKEPVDRTVPAGEVADIALEHARLLSEWAGEPHAMRMFRRHSSWYTKGFRASFDVQLEPGQATDLRVFLRHGSRRITETWTRPFKAE